MENINDDNDDDIPQHPDNNFIRINPHVQQVPDEEEPAAPAAVADPAPIRRRQMRRRRIYRMFNYDPNEVHAGIFEPSLKPIRKFR